VALARLLGLAVARSALWWPSAWSLGVTAACGFWLPTQLRSMHVTSPAHRTECAQAGAGFGFALAAGMIGSAACSPSTPTSATTMTDVAGPAEVSGSVGGSMVFWCWPWWVATWVGGAVGGPIGHPCAVTCRWLRLRRRPWGCSLPGPRNKPVDCAAGVVRHRRWAGLGRVAPRRCRPADGRSRHDAQTLAAALNHSALNIGNATGAWGRRFGDRGGPSATRRPPPAGALLAAGPALAGAHRVGGGCNAGTLV